MDAPTASGESRSRRARTGAPACASTAFTPSVRSSVLLPDMFEPLTTSTRSAARPGAHRCAPRGPRGISGWPIAFRLQQRPVSPANSGNGSAGCSKAWLASEHSASISPVAVSQRRTAGPECAPPRPPPRSARCVVHSTNGSATRTSTWSRESSSSISRLSRPMRLEGGAPSVSSERAARPAAASGNVSRSSRTSTSESSFSSCAASSTAVTTASIRWCTRYRKVPLTTSTTRKTSRSSNAGRAPISGRLPGGSARTPPVPRPPPRPAP